MTGRNQIVDAHAESPTEVQEKPVAWRATTQFDSAHTASGRVGIAELLHRHLGLESLLADSRAELA
jgi:hypothetical protein